MPGMIKNNDFDEAVCARERQGNKDKRKQRKIQVTTTAERRDQQSTLLLKLSLVLFLPSEGGEISMGRFGHRR